MTLAIDIDYGREEIFPIDVSLLEGYQGYGDQKENAHPPSICLTIADEYVKCGLPFFFHVELHDLFDEYLRDYWENSHGDETPTVIKMLREYADKIEADLAKRLGAA